MKLNWPLIVVLAPIALATFGQIHLVQRHPVPTLPSQFSDPNCGTPAHPDLLIQWICAGSFRNVLASGDFATNCDDICPTMTNGIYFTNIYSARKARFLSNNPAAITPYALHFTNTLGHPYVYAQSNAWWVGLTNAQIFWVGKITTNVTDNAIWSMNNDGNDMLWTAGDRNHASLAWCSSTYKLIPINYVTGWGNVKWFSIWSSPNDWGFVTNGVTCYTTNVNTVQFPNAATNGFYGWATGTYPVNYYHLGLLSEILVYKRQLTTGEMTDVDNYIKNKYGW